MLKLFHGYLRMTSDLTILKGESEYTANFTLKSWPWGEAQGKFKVNSDYISPVIHRKINTRQNYIQTMTLTRTLKVPGQLKLKGKYFFTLYLRTLLRYGLYPDLKVKINLMQIIFL